MTLSLTSFKDLRPQYFQTSWKSPSNIAFIKYWGKKGFQLPANPSLSMTLEECLTTTQSTFSPASELSVSLKLDGIANGPFAQKIKDYLTFLSSDLPWIQKLNVDIETTNTFPHGTGIASSASGLSAFALTLCDYIKELSHHEDDDAFFARASFLSRIASGSACRSLYGGFVSWGASELPGSSDFYGLPLEVHPSFKELRDSILIISCDEKNVSSSKGHGRMNEHFYAEARYTQAKYHFKSCVAALKHGDIELVGKILEAEALALHAMMLTSPQVYTLLKPNTLRAIELIWDFRKLSRVPLYFTLDAGPNLHLIYPSSSETKIVDFISKELGHLGERIIHDRIGQGPKKC